MSVLRAQHLGSELCVNAARASFSVSTGAGRGGAWQLQISMGELSSVQYRSDVYLSLLHNVKRRDSGQLGSYFEIYSGKSEAVLLSRLA